MTKRALAWICLALVAWGCATSPLGRRQLILFPESQMAQLGVAAFDKMKTEVPLSKDAKKNAYVSCVSNHVTDALEGEAGRQTWEVLVFDDESANAFALPGGKIGVHTGLLEVAETQDQLATVIGHEVAHVLAQHSNERVSTSQVAGVGLAVASAAIGSQGGQGDQYMALLGLGAQVGVLLPFGRKQESEADIVGLDLMASAGFDPRSSIKLWQNMGKANEGKAPPEFLSTHPSHTTRIADLNERLATAVPLYEKARAAGKRPNCR